MKRMAEKPAETIQTLLQAEEAAKEVIDKARKRKHFRFKNMLTVFLVILVMYV